MSVDRVMARISAIQAAFPAAAAPASAVAVAAAAAEGRGAFAAHLEVASHGGVRAASAGQTVPADGAWVSRLPPAGRPWADEIAAAAASEGVDPALLAALVWCESGFRPDARSGAGAVGLGQLMPATARELGVDPADPAQNLRGAARYLRLQLDRFGTLDVALAAYNAGPGAVGRAGGIPPYPETQAYVGRVSSRYAELGGSR